MSTISASCEVRCSFSIIIERVAAYLEEHHGKLELVLPLGSLGFPLLLNVRRDAKTKFLVTRDATDHAHQHDAIAISWHPFNEGLFPDFTGLITARPMHDHANLTIDGRYRPPFRFFGALFDMAVGKRIASATARALILDIQRFIEERDLPKQPALRSAETTK